MKPTLFNNTEQKNHSFAELTEEAKQLNIRVQELTEKVVQLNKKMSSAISSARLFAQQQSIHSTNESETPTSSNEFYRQFGELA